ncbi:MAG TPA: GAF domain-containing sensor histidine kinase [Ktedonobacteraceae bacterium]|jgi:two-component system NarL family sensor kinase|nr:GAF domain-containing sensor histidine kinase [Ktedonobacteraceae bacterium]
MDTDARDNLNEQGAQHAHTDEATSLLRGNRDLAVLYTIASQLNRKVDVREMLQEVLSQVTRLFGLQTGWVWLLDEERRPFLAAALALPPYLADHHERMEGSCLCLDTFLSGTLAGAANIDVLRCSRLKNAEREGDPTSRGLRVHASVPIYAGEMALGVLNVASEDWRELAEEELQLLHIVGDQIGLAIQRARLAAEHTRAAARLATIEERNRLAREIHDTLAQGLAAITLQLETADALNEQRPERAHEAIRRALALARANLEDARRSVIDLRAAPLQNRTLSGALRELAQEAEATGVAVIYQYTPVDFPLLSPRLETGLYRIAQEALTNVKKHAQASQVKLTLALEGDELCLSVYDDGRGFQVDEALGGQARFGIHTGHFGLTGMSERVKLLGGTLCIDSTPGSGTCLAACVPLEKDGRE